MDRRSMHAYMVLGGQWGSEGKGLFAGYIARQRDPDMVVCQFGPNAGHTWYEGDKPIVFKALPVAAIAPSVKRIFLGPGSVINPSILKREIEEMGKLLEGKTIFVHEAAAILHPEDAEKEMDTVTHIASTRQGTSEAMIRKIRRQGTYEASKALEDLPVRVVSHSEYTKSMWGLVQIEGAQGMDLSINSGHMYPYTTSRDCTPAQVLADCGIHPYELIQVLSCIRTFPIRVGNIIGGNGLVLGSSGPCYADQIEHSWESIGQPQEYTTVTKRVRRVFSFSMEQTLKMLEELRPTGVFLNFMNYLTPEEGQKLINQINKLAGCNIVLWTGHGPKASDIKGVEYGKSKPTEYGE